jgi:hypothetical protein
MAVHTAFVLVVTVGSPEYGGTDRTREMLDMVLSVQSRDIRAAESLATVKTQQVQSFEVVGLAEGVLARRLVRNREELGGDDFAAVLGLVSGAIPKRQDLGWMWKRAVGGVQLHRREQ